MTQFLVFGSPDKRLVICDSWGCFQIVWSLISHGCSHTGDGKDMESYMVGFRHGNLAREYGVAIHCRFDTEIMFYVLSEKSVTLTLSLWLISIHHPTFSTRNHTSYSLLSNTSPASRPSLFGMHRVTVSANSYFKTSLCLDVFIFREYQVVWWIF